MGFRLFVYGTLKRGLRNHSLCIKGQFLGSGKIHGHLYDLSAGYPALTVPIDSVLAWGTGDIERDCQIQDGIIRKALKKYEYRTLSLRDTVTGEIYEFHDPTNDIPPLDQLEGFHPFETIRKSLYRRALVPMELEGNIKAVWTYVMEEPVHGLRLPAGIWPAI